MFDLEDFLYCFCYFDAICTKTIEMAVGVRGGVWQPYVTSHALNLFLTVDVVDQSLCGDNLLHELGECLSLEALAGGEVFDHTGIKVDLDFVTIVDLAGCLGTLNDG